jgi:hypothetical protein
MPEATQQQLAVPPQQAAEDDPDTEGEFKVLWADANDGRERLRALARAATEAGHQEIAKVYTEVAETVLGLLVDLTMTTGGAIMRAEDDIADLEEEQDEKPGGDGSSLLPEDADKYLQLFGQYIRLFDGLAEVIPPGADGDAQREVFATLRRMTEGMMEFTESIVTEPEDDDEDEEPEK